jgi:hypothetical protein
MAISCVIRRRGSLQVVRVVSIEVLLPKFKDLVAALRCAKFMLITKATNDEGYGQHDKSGNPLLTRAEPYCSNAAKANNNIEPWAKAEHEAGSQDDNAADDESATGNTFAHGTQR